jgi:hypothetical protein
MASSYAHLRNRSSANQLKAFGISSAIVFAMAIALIATLLALNPGQ